MSKNKIIFIKRVFFTFMLLFALEYLLLHH